MYFYLAIAIGLIVLGTISASFFIYKKVKNYDIKAVMIKTLTSFLFVVVGAFCFYASDRHPIGIFVIVGLVLGMLGDVFLGLKHVYKADSSLFTKAGFVCFASGHIVYVIGMFSEFFTPNSSFLYILLPLVAALLLGFILVFMEKPWKLDYGSMRKIIFIYGFLLFSSPCSALSLSILHNFSVVPLAMLMGAGFLFTTSDLLLCGTYFGENRDTPINNIINSVTYYLAQYAIAFSLFFL